MTPDKEQQIYASAPTLFSSIEIERKNLKERKLFHPIAFGIECGDGWFELIKECVSKIEAEMRRLELSEIRAIQIKEKFGGLRIYLTCETESISTFIEEAENKARKTCEECGEVGRPRSGSWIQTLCNTCHQRQRKGSTDGK